MRGSLSGDVGQVENFHRVVWQRLSIYLFYHTCRELSTRFAHVCIGAVRAWDEEHLISVSWWWQRVSYINKRAAMLLGGLMGYERNEETKVPGNQFEYVFKVW